METQLRPPRKLTPSFFWLIHHWEAFIAFGFGVGLSPKFPGTLGSLVAFLPALILFSIHPSNYSLVLMVLLFFGFGVWVAGKTEKKLGYEDPSGIVIDEILAMFLVLLCIPQDWFYWLLAFCLFRIFDITKLYPIGLLEVRFSGGLGIMLDDLMAALYTILLLLFPRLL
ncbi:MAG: phosphatidylglycerophosphatase A [Neisseriaceae bacterium]